MHTLSHPHVPRVWLLVTLVALASLHVPLAVSAAEATIAHVPSQVVDTASGPGGWFLAVLADGRVMRSGGMGEAPVEVKLPSGAEDSLVAEVYSHGDVVVAVGGGMGKVHFVSKDGGASWQPMSTPLAVDVARVPVARASDLVSFHPHQNGWWLARFASDGCLDKPRFRCFRVIGMTKDYGASWSLIADYVVQHGWAAQLKASAVSDDAVLVVKWSARASEDSQLDVDYSLDMFFGVLNAGRAARIDEAPTSILAVPIIGEVRGGAAFELVAPSFVYVETLEDDGAAVHLTVSSDGKEFNRVKLPNSLTLEERAHQFLDDGTDAVVLHIAEHASWGHLYTSSADGVSFALMLEHVHENDIGPAFGPLASVEGVLAANVVDNPFAGANAPLVITTLVSTDAGGSWQPLMGPQRDAHDAPLPCALDGAGVCPFAIDLGARGCLAYALSAPGIVYAAGALDGAEGAAAFSSDAGASWELLSGDEDVGFWMVRDGGAVLRVPREQTQFVGVRHVTGAAFSAVALSDDGSNVRVVGVTDVSVIDDKSASSTRYSWMLETESFGGVGLVRVDVVPPSLPPVCIPSQYESWSPGYGCVLGRKNTYRRRKPDALCVPLESHDGPDADHCTCTAADWECDVGYVRESQDDPDAACALESGKDAPDDTERGECPADGYYRITRGYRRVAGDSCIDGADDPFAPSRKWCGNEVSGSPGASRAPLFIVLGIAVITLAIGGAWVYRRAKVLGLLSLVGAPVPRTGHERLISDSEAGSHASDSADADDGLPDAVDSLWRSDGLHHVRRHRRIVRQRPRTGGRGGPLSALG